MIRLTEGDIAKCSRDRDDEGHALTQSVGARVRAYTSADWYDTPPFGDATDAMRPDGTAALLAEGARAVCQPSATHIEFEEMQG